MKGILKLLWFTLFARPLIFLIMGVNVRNRQGLGTTSPSIVVANHNSHLDALVLMSMFPLSSLRKVRPVAAQDYFLRNRWLAWFALNVIGIIPFMRLAEGRRDDPFAACSAALTGGETLIFFPEGSRGEPERMAEFRTGIAHLARRHPNTPVIPVFLQGTGKSLPRGEWVLVPVICDVVVGAALHWDGCRKSFMKRLADSFERLASTVSRHGVD
jgi:1-acyl-sn-glycerol-3-phosphate acyltransferase